MSEQELMLVQVGQVLHEVARPYSCEAPLPGHVQASLWRLGVPCDELTPRQHVVALLWARKRSLSSAVQPPWRGPEPTPAPAA
jgi:hypothetical protein